MATFHGCRLGQLLRSTRPALIDITARVPVIARNASPYITATQPRPDANRLKNQSRAAAANSRDRDIQNYAPV